MNVTIVGLGNPGTEYDATPHNVGRYFVDQFAHTYEFPEWELDKKKQALISKGVIEKTKFELVLPETFMNKSGKSVAHLAGKKKAIEQLIVVHDDLDLPLGSMKISFGRGSAGHKGIDSIVKSIKSKDFVRVRIGVCPVTPAGKLKKPKGEMGVSDFIIGKCKPKEFEVITKMKKRVLDALEIIALDGRIRAMNECN